MKVVIMITNYIPKTHASNTCLKTYKKWISKIINVTYTFTLVTLSTAHLP